MKYKFFVNLVFSNFFQKVWHLSLLYPIDGMYRDVDNKKFDHKYGIRFYSDTEKLMTGDSQIFIIASDIIIQNIKYKRTQGLYELLFKKIPINFSKQDEENYIDY